MIYLDNNATTFLDPCVLEEMLLVLSGEAGNPSSVHHYGQVAKALLAQARKDVANFFGVQPREVIFTSGATEAINMVIRSVPAGQHIITSSLEHISVLEAVKNSGCNVTYLDPLPGMGSISLGQIEEVVTEKTAMIVLMASNNETGIKTDIKSIADYAHKSGLKFVVDGVAFLGKDKWEMFPGISAACFSGHKIHAPMGVGVALVRKSFFCKPLIFGGPQQYNLRGGTENLGGIVAFSKALSLLPQDVDKVMRLRDLFEKELISRLSNVKIHGVNEPRVCNTSNMAFLGVDGESLLMQLDLAGVAAGYGAACSSGSLELSRVLLNMNIPSDEVRSSIRFSLSRFTTEDEIRKALDIIVGLIKKLNRL